MKFLYILFVFLCAHINNDVESAKILGVFPYPSKSHSILGQALFNELAKRGHDITFLSPYPLKKVPYENYKDIAITSPKLFASFQEELDMCFEEIDYNPFAMMKYWIDNIARMQKYTLSDPAVQELLHSNEKFDLCIIEFLMNESLLGFGAQFGCKIIAVSTLGQVKYINDMVHSPMPLSVVTHPFLEFTDRMTYRERMTNIFFHYFEDIMFQIYHYPLQGAIYDKFFKADKPSFKHMLKHSVSLVLLNTHYSLNYPQAYLPNMIEIGGFHVKNQTNQLPEDINNFIESAEHGVIYFSMGGNLRPSKMSEQKKKDILGALSKIKEKVIWKWDEELDVDKNKFLIRNWLPQDDILAHPNVKLFVTHGGLLSCTESIIRGKPVVGIPVFGDQMMNMARAELLGWGARVPYLNLNESTLLDALNEVLGKDKYQKKVLEVRKRLLDQPQTPMEKAIFYVEYVLRHDGAYFMQTSAQHLTFVQYNNLDVYGTFLAVLLFAIFISSYLIKKAFQLSKAFGSYTEKQKKN